MYCSNYEKKRNISTHERVEIEPIPVWIAIMRCRKKEYWYKNLINHTVSALPVTNSNKFVLADKKFTGNKGLIFFINRSDANILMFLN